MGGGYFGGIYFGQYAPQVVPQRPWVDVDDLIKAHARLTRAEKERPAVNRFALEAAVEGALQSVGGIDAYESLFDKIAAMILSINHRHCFGDGNKRVSLIAAVLCMKLNGLSLRDSPDVEQFFWRIGSGQENQQSVSQWLQHMALKDPEPERPFTPTIEGFFEW